MSKGSRRRPTANERMAAANWEIKDGGWSECVEDQIEIGESIEVCVFYNRHDPEDGRWYWRPKDSFDNSSKAGAIE